MNPETLRKVPYEWATSGDNGTLEALQAKLDAAADAWEDQLRHAWEDATHLRVLLDEKHKRLEAAEKRRLVHAEHLPGCMEPGFVEDDCACGLRELRAALAEEETK